MILRLTKMGSPVLVNFQNVTNCEVYQTQQGTLTKIYVVGGTYVNVEETIEDILKLQLDWVNGVYQDTTTQIPSLNQRFENSYSTTTYKRPRRQRVFNNSDVSNDGIY
jgi:hypothetical protein